MTSVGRQLRDAEALPPIPAVSPSPSARASRPSRRLQQLVPRAWAGAGGASWFVLLTIAVSIEPQPSDPTAVPSLVETLFMTVFLVALSATAFGLSARRRAGFAASLLGAGVLVVGVLLCPVTGHHETGLWWYGQLASVSGLVVVSAFGLLRAPTVGD
ncbi:MAG: hypothetical protein M3252_04210 [Actinomycetota bacterium]|nr:hypothetical protein [Actinomycetota bacterium]